FSEMFNSCCINLGDGKKKALKFSENSQWESLTGGIKWHPVIYEDDKRRFIAKLPGEIMENPMNHRTCFFHSYHQNIHYVIHMRPISEPIPDTLEQFLDYFDNLDQAQIIALEPTQPLIRYSLQIYFPHDERTMLHSICRFFA